MKNVKLLLLQIMTFVVICALIVEIWFWIQPGAVPDPAKRYEPLPPETWERNVDITGSEIPKPSVPAPPPIPPLPPQYEHMMEASTDVTPSASAMLSTERAENDEAICYYYRSSISCFPKAIR